MVFCTIDEDIPVFGKIIDIVVISHDDCVLVLRPYVGSNFCSHYNAYEVHPSHSQYLIYKQKDLIDHHTLSMNKSFAPSLAYKNFVCLKYHVES